MPGDLQLQLRGLRLRAVSGGGHAGGGAEGVGGDQVAGEAGETDEARQEERGHDSSRTGLESGHTRKSVRSVWFVRW